jgi:hypothetical protein
MNIFINQGNYYTSNGPKPKVCKCGGNCKCKRPCGCGSSCVKCTTVSLDETLQLLSRINYKIVTLSRVLKENLVDKFDATVEESKLEKLVILREPILRYKNRLINEGKQCLTSGAIQLIFEKARHLLGVGYSPERSLQYTLNSNVPLLEDGLTIDDSKLNSWLLKNPYCAPVNEWEKLAYHICGNLDIQIDVEEIKCNLTFDIVKEALPLSVVSGLSLAQIAMKNKFLNIRTEDECKLDWELLVEEIPGCDMDYDVYIKLVKDCNLTFDIVKDAYECGLSFTVKDGQTYLNGKTFQYDLSEINFNSLITNYKSVSIDGAKLSADHILDKDLLSFGSDYKLTEKQLRNLRKK